MARVATVTPTAFEDFTDILLDSLSDPDPGIRGLALRALSPNARVAKVRPIQPLEKDTSELNYYDPAVGEFRRTTVGEIARRILAKCGSR